MQRLLAEGQISPGHARALLGTPDRGYQEVLARTAVADALTVRTIEDLVREHNLEAEGVRDMDREPVAVPSADDGEPIDYPSDENARSAAGSSGATPGPRQLPPPGILELEELLASHLNTRVKVDMTAKRGKVVVEFATLEDLERIYKLMVGGVESSPVG